MKKKKVGREVVEWKWKHVYRAARAEYIKCQKRVIVVGQVQQISCKHHAAKYLCSAWRIFFELCESFEGAADDDGYCVYE